MTVSCPKCGTATHRAFFPLWVILISICFFPFGLLSLLAGRKPSQCPNCGFSWQA